MTKRKGMKGKDNPSWKRGWAYSSDGAIFIHENGTQVLEHRKIVAEILKRPLNSKNPIHHLDKNQANNSNSNLVLCENDAYHQLLHMRKRAYDACGHANWLRCKYCKKYDSPKNIKIQLCAGRERTYHKPCRNKYMREWKKRRVFEGLS